MKKFMIIASMVALVGSIFANCINSAAWSNQPKSPSMLMSN